MPIDLPSIKIALTQLSGHYSDSTKKQNNPKYWRIIYEGWI